MTVESVTYLSDLDDTYPASGGSKSEGDDHIRNIKTGLLGSFPNFAGAAVTKTEAEINDLATKTGAETLTNKTLTSPTLNTPTFSAGAVDTADIANDAIDGTKIATNAVNADAIIGGAVGTSELASSAVTTVKIDDEAVTNAKLADDAVGANELADGAVDFETHMSVATSSSTSTATTSNTTPLDRHMWNLYNTHGSNSLDVQVQINSTWRTLVSLSPASSYQIYSDGTNVRLRGNGGTCSYAYTYFK